MHNLHYKYKITLGCFRLCVRKSLFLCSSCRKGRGGKQKKWKCYWSWLVSSIQLFQLDASYNAHTKTHIFFFFFQDEDLIWRKNLLKEEKGNVSTLYTVQGDVQWI